MYYVKVLDGLLFVSHWKGNFSFNGVFSGASPPKLSFHIQSVKVVDLNGRGGGGEPIRSIFTLEWKLREDPTLQIISHSHSIGDFIQSFHLLASQLPPNMRMSAAATKVSFLTKELRCHVWYFDRKYLFGEYGEGWYCAHCILTIT